MPDTRSDPQIVEAYKNYTPPFDAAKVVRILLRYVPEQHLTGLRTIVLTNHAALSHDQRRRKLWSRGRKYSMNEIRGTYHQAWKGAPAWITVFVDATIETIPQGVRWLPILRTHAFGEVLYHEIGHHIHKTSKPEFREREDVADDWKRRLEHRFGRRRYWYLFPVASAVMLARKTRKLFRGSR
jgi:hypothetical protein